MGPIYVPQLLDSSERFLIFYLYEMMIFIVFGFGSYYLGQRTLGIFIGIASFLIIRRARRKGLLKDIRSTIYWYAPFNFTSLMARTEKLPPSYKRVLVG